MSIHLCIDWLHLAADRLPKDLLSPQPSGHSPIQQMARTQLYPPVRRHQLQNPLGPGAALQEAWPSLWISLTHQGAKNRFKKTTIP